MDDRLRQIIENAQPAQAAHARRLLQQGGTSAEIALLYDAYLNDPYLTR